VEEITGDKKNYVLVQIPPPTKKKVERKPNAQKLEEEANKEKDLGKKSL